MNPIVESAKNRPKSKQIQDYCRFYLSSISKFNNSRWKTYSYCWWKKSQTTTWDVWNPGNNGIFTISTGDRRIFSINSISTGSSINMGRRLEQTIPVSSHSSPLVSHVQKTRVPDTCHWNTGCFIGILDLQIVFFSIPTEPGSISSPTNPLNNLFFNLRTIWSWYRIFYDFFLGESLRSTNLEDSPFPRCTWTPTFHSL